MSTPRELANLFAHDKPAHAKALQWLRSIGNRACSANEEKHARWVAVEKQNRMYVSADEVDRDGNLRNVGQSDIIVPWQRAIRDTMLAQTALPWMTKFPMLPLSSESPEGYIAAQLMAVRCDYDMYRMKGRAKLHAAFGNAFDFGLSPIETRWVSDKRTRRSVTSKGNVRELVEHYEGNWTEVLDPYRMLLDPDVSAGKHQTACYCGYSRDVSYAEVQRLAAAKDRNEEGWFNTDKIRETTMLPTEVWLFGSRNASVRNRVQGLSDPMSWNASAGIESSVGEYRTQSHILTVLEAAMTPADFGEYQLKGVGGLPVMFTNGDSTKQQFWRWTVLDGRWIVDVEPMSQTEFSIDILEPSPDFLSRMVPGLAEQTLDMSLLINWLFNSHIRNVERGLYGVTGIDPEVWNMEDARTGVLGGFVRVNPEYSGRNNSGTLIPFPWQDATRSNMGDIPLLSDMMQRLWGTSDQSMGLVSQGRRTSLDVATASQGAGARSQTVGLLMAICGLNDWFSKIVRNIQLFDESERWYAITGSLAQVLTGGQGPPPPLRDSQVQQRPGPNGAMQTYALITPEDIKGNFQMALMDGRPETDDVQRAQSLTQLMDTAGRYGMFGGPNMPPQLNPMWFIRNIAAGLGHPNLRDAEIQARPQQQPLIPPEDQMGMIDSQVQAGNIVPMQQPQGY